MTDLPTLKVKSLVNFPANTFGRVGISVDKEAGAFYVDLDYEKFTPPINALPPDPTPFYSLIWNLLTNSYSLCPLVFSGATSPSNTAPLMDGVAAPGVSVLFSRGDHIHPTDTSRAPLDSPAFINNPTAPTPAPGDNDQSLATTAFVNTAVNSAVTTNNGISRVVTAAGAVAVAVNDRVVAINKTTGAATAVSLPAASTKNGPVVIADIKRDAGTNNITITPNGTETIEGLATLTLAANGASAQLWPLSGVGWAVS